MRGNSFGSYLKEIGRYDILSKKEERSLGRNVQDMMRLFKIRDVHGLKGDAPTKEWADAANLTEKELRRMLAKGKWAKDKFIKHNLRLVVSIAKKYVDRGLALADLVQEGSVGLNRAAEKFDPEKGFKFSTYSCVPLSTLIYTKTGWKKYDEVLPGDETLGYNQGNLEWTKIKGIKVHKQAPTVKFSSDNWSVRCTDQHKWLIAAGTQEPSLKPLYYWTKQSDHRLVTSGCYEQPTLDISEMHASWLAEMYCGVLRTDLNEFMTALWKKSKLEEVSIEEFLMTISSAARIAWVVTYTKCMKNAGRLADLHKNTRALAFGLYLNGYEQVKANYDPTKQTVVKWAEEQLTPQTTQIENTGKEDVWCPSTDLESWTACTEDGHIFVTGNTWWIRQGITRAVAVHSRTIRLPVHIFERLNKIKKVSREISQEMKRPPTVQEIAKAIGEKEFKVLRLIEHARTTKSLDSLICDYSANGSSIGELMIDTHTVSPEELLERDMNKEYVGKLLDKSLNEQERFIIKHRYGVDIVEPVPLKDIGVKLGITTERVRQIERRALLKLKEVHKLYEQQQDERLKTLRDRTEKKNTKYKVTFRDPLEQHNELEKDVS
jgi:RNA polymerase sigma factor (sigma-70 family)